MPCTRLLENASHEYRTCSVFSWRPQFPVQLNCWGPLWEQLAKKPPDAVILPPGLNQWVQTVRAVKSSAAANPRERAELLKQTKCLVGWRSCRAVVTADKEPLPFLQRNRASPGVRAHDWAQRGKWAVTKPHGAINFCLYKEMEHSLVSTSSPQFSNRGHCFAPLPLTTALVHGTLPLFTGRAPHLRHGTASSAVTPHPPARPGAEPPGMETPQHGHATSASILLLSL